MIIYCCQCKQDVDSLLVTGKDVYGHRKDLHSLPFWRCNTCRNFVGCHHKTKNRTKPLGVIANKEIKNARIHIHALLDPIWQKKRLPSGVIYAKINEKLGYPYHTAEIRDIDVAREVYRIVREIARGLDE